MENQLWSLLLIILLTNLGTFFEMSNGEVTKDFSATYLFSLIP